MKDSWKHSEAYKMPRCTDQVYCTVLIRCQNVLVRKLADCVIDYQDRLDGNGVVTNKSIFTYHLVLHHMELAMRIVHS